jgi:fructose-1,6-bisphosphatase II
MIVKVWKNKKGDAKRMDWLKAARVDINKTYTEDKLAKGKEMIFAASGVTKGEMLDGVRFTAGGAIVQSIFTRLPSGSLEWSTTDLKFKDHPIYKQIT